MATIIEQKINKTAFEKAEEHMQTQIPDKDVMEQIMVDPLECLKDDDFLLDYVVDNGYHSSILCEALGIKNLELKIKEKTYRMFYSQPHPMFNHSDVMFKTEKYKQYKKHKFLVDNTGKQHTIAQL